MVKRIMLIIAALCVAAAGLQCGAGNSGDRLEIPPVRSGCLLLDGDVDRLSWDTPGSVVWEAPLDDRVLFSFPLPYGERFESYGLGKFDLKIDGGPVTVMVFVERPGEKRRVYRPIDITIPREGWQTIHFDLAMPEIVRESHYEAESPRLSFNLWAMKGGYVDEEPLRRIEIKNIRLTKRRLDVRWNGVDYQASTAPDGGLVYEYPIVVANNDNTGRRVHARLDHWEGLHGKAVITPESATIAAGDSARFTARLTLPAAMTKEAPPLYCEWFMPVFEVDGILDSEEGVLRSSDRIALPLIKMPERLVNPVILFGPDDIEDIRARYRTTDWGKREGDGWIKRAEAAVTGDLTIPDGQGWTAAYYYCVEHRTPLRYEGPDRHKCPVGGEYLDVDFMGVDLDLDYRTNQHAAMFNAAKDMALAYMLTGDNRFSEGALTILRQYCEKYFTWPWLDLDASAETIDKGRVQFAKYMESMYMLNLTEAYDILKGLGAVSEEEMQDLEHNFIIPISVEMTDYRMGILHRQKAITKNALATGLTCGHAPLVAFAAAGPTNFRNIRKCAATADGIAHEHGYTTVIRRQVEMAEMLDRVGIDTFDSTLERLLTGGLWWSSPFNPSANAAFFLKVSKHYPNPIYRTYASRNLIDGEAPASPGLKIDFGQPPSVNFPNSGLSILRRPWKHGGMLDAEFKWGIPDNRGSFSVLSLGLHFGGYRCQSYPGQFAWGSTDLHHAWQIQSASHSTIVVDRRNQSGMKDYFKDQYRPHTSRQVMYEEGARSSSTVAFNDRIYPGVAVWRTVSVLDGAYLVIDLLRSDEEHVYDRWFHGVPDRSNGLAGIGLDMKPRTEPLGNTDGYDMISNLSAATTTNGFTCDWTVNDTNAMKGLRLATRVLNDAPLEAVHGFEWSRQFSTPEKEFLLLTRTAKNADFIVLHEPYVGRSTVTEFRRFDVAGPDGAIVDTAVGVYVTVDGTRYEVILNPGGVKVKTVRGETGKILSVEVIGGK